MSYQCPDCRKEVTFDQPDATHACRISKWNVRGSGRLMGMPSEFVGAWLNTRLVYTPTVPEDETASSPVTYPFKEHQMTMFYTADFGIILADTREDASKQAKERGVTIDPKDWLTRETDTSTKLYRYTFDVGHKGHFGCVAIVATSRDDAYKTLMESIKDTDPENWKEESLRLPLTLGSTGIMIPRSGE